MINTTTLYQGLLSLLDRGQWRDQRHLKAAVNMLVGLMLSSSIRLTGGFPMRLVEQLLPKRQGKAVFLHHVHITGQRHSPGHLALVRPPARFDKKVKNFLSFLQFAGALIWLR